MLTVATALAHITNTLGDGELPAEVSGLALLNSAGRQMESMRDWNYLRSNTASLSLVADQDYVDLPTGTKAIRAIETPNSLTSGISLVSLADVLQRRTANAGSSLFYLASLVFVSDTNGIPRPKLALWPTPTASGDGFRVFYDREWTDLDSDEGFIPVPPYMENLYIQVVRAFSRGWIEEDEGALDQRLALIQGGPVYAAARYADEAIQTTFGVASGGVGDVGRGYGRSWTTYSASGPS